MNPCHEYLNNLTRRQFFAGAGLAMGGVALNWLASPAEESITLTAQVEIRHAFRVEAHPAARNGS